MAPPRILLPMLALLPAGRHAYIHQQILGPTFSVTRPTLRRNTNRRTFLTMKASSSSSTSSATSTTTPTLDINKNVKDRFILVPYGKTASDINFPKSNDNNDNDNNNHNNKNKNKSTATTIACDGRVEGTTLELTHWNGNETPHPLYADTSTEIALNFFKSRLEHFQNPTQQQGSQATESVSLEMEKYDEAWVLNNHFDTDGVLSCWIACHAVQLQPPQNHPSNLKKVATMMDEYTSLLLSAAEAGDFGEWSSPNGVKLNIALVTLYKQLEESSAAAYEKALDILPDLLHAFTYKNGKAYEELWHDEYERVVQEWQDVQDGKIKVEVVKQGLVLVTECEKEEEEEEGGGLSAYGLHRALVEMGHDAKTEEENRIGPSRMTRVLRATPSKTKDGTTLWKYTYEKPGHGWVNRLVSRPPVPPADGTALTSMLNDEMNCVWKKGGEELISICHTVEFVEQSPQEVIGWLMDNDEGLSV